MGETSGWIEFDLRCSTILPSCSANSVEIPSATAESGRQWKCQDQSQPSQSRRADGAPCTEMPRKYCPRFRYLRAGAHTIKAKISGI